MVSHLELGSGWPCSLKLRPAAAIWQDVSPWELWRRHLSVNISKEREWTCVRRLTVSPQVLKCIDSYITGWWFHQDQVAARMSERIFKSKERSTAEKTYSKEFTANWTRSGSLASPLTRLSTSALTSGISERNLIKCLSFASKYGTIPSRTFKIHFS